MADAKVILSAEDRTARAFASAKQSLTSFNDQATRTGGALAGLGAALTFAGMAGFIKSSNDGVDALNDLKDATGASIENISALEGVATETGTSLETVASALTKFNKVLGDTDPNSDAARALKQIGLNAEELRRLDPADALLKTSQALAKFADDGNKARLVQELFGKSTRELAPFLKDLADKGELVATVTTRQAEEAEKFNKELFKLEKGAKDVGRALVSDLVVGINAAAKAFRESGLIEGIRTLLTGTDEFKSSTKLFELTNDLLRAENDLARSRTRDAQFGDKSLVTAAAEKRVALLKEEIKTTQAYRTVLDQANAPAAAPAATVGALGVKAEKAKTEQIEESRRALASYVQALQGNLNVADKLTETEKALNFLRSQGVQGQVPQVRELVLGLAAQVDAEKELVAVLQMKRDVSVAAGDEVNKANAAYQTRLTNMLEATPSANLEKQRADVRLLTDEFEAGRLSEEQYLEVVTTRLQLTNDQLKETNTFAKDVGLTFTSSFEDAISSGEKLSDVLKGLGADLLKLGVRKFVTEPLGNAFNDIFKSISVGGGGLGGAGGGFGTGSAFGNLDFGGFFANGGSPPVGKVSVVGERGPELFVPKMAGTIIPNGMLGGQGMVYSPTINVDSRTDQAEVRRIVERAVLAGNARLIDQMQTAG